MLSDDRSGVLPYRDRKKPGFRWRASIAIGTGAAAALVAIGYLVWTEHRLGSAFHSDLDMQLAAARILLRGGNPYASIGPGLRYDWPWRLYYPAPALIVLAPFAWLPAPVARAAFAGGTSFALGFALAYARQPWWRYLIFASACAQSAVLLGQGSLIFAAAYVLPPLAIFAVIKPNVGAAIATARIERSWWTFAIFGGLVLIAASFAVAPRWLGWWLDTVRTDPTRSEAVARPWGFLLAFAAVRWRRPEGRLVLALSLLPQTLGVYDAALLFVVPGSAVESIAMVILSHFIYVLSFGYRTASLNEAVVRHGISVVHCLYLPSLLLVLRRPNSGNVPAWLERIASAAPRWIRGTAA